MFLMVTIYHENKHKTYRIHDTLVNGSDKFKSLRFPSFSRYLQYEIISCSKAKCEILEKQAINSFLARIVFVTTLNIQNTHLPQERGL